MSYLLLATTNGRRPVVAVRDASASKEPSKGCKGLPFCFNVPTLYLNGKHVIPKEVQITSCGAIVLVGLVKRKPSTHICSLKGKFPLPGLQFLDLYLLFCPFVRPRQPETSVALLPSLQSRDLANCFLGPS